MKRFVAVLSGLLVLPAFAEVAPVNYEDIIEYEDTAVVSEEIPEEGDDDVAAPVAQPSVVNPRGVSAGRGAVTRALPSVSSNAAASRSVASGRVVSSARPGASTSTARSANTTRATVARSAGTRTTVARSASGAGQIASTRRAMQASEPATVARASALQTSGASLYSGNRVSTRASAIRARAPITTPISVENAIEGEAVMDTTSMDELAQLTDFCKAQYTSCMDNYCNVLDENQGRCSCSKNIKNYEKTENALKAATEALQDVAQQIQYIGLTKDEIETLFAQTEAEAAMQSNTDNTQLKNDLDRIKDLIVNVKTASASTTAVGGISMDLSGLLDFNIDSTGFDLSALFGTNSTNTSSISNQRGEQLYKTAVARCKATVLNNCTAQGVDASLITNSYDLEIDKQCLAYERSLTEANNNMSSTVRNAKNVLQRARLMVAQNKNSYDLRGCVNALDSCMQDEYVCGTDYEYCLDPSNTYVVNGEIVVGSTPGQSGVISTNSGLYASTWTYKTNGTDQSAWTDNGSGEGLSAFVSANLQDSINKEVPSTTANLVEYLVYKIGYIENGKPYGMCASVLNQCQDYTYKDGKYVQKNRVIESYLERTMIQIKAAQDELLADYAENCISDVSECLSDNNYTYSSSNTTYSNPSDTAIKACDATIKTCMSVTGETYDSPAGTNVQKWLDDALGTSLTQKGKCIRSGGGWSDPSTCTCSGGGTPGSSGYCEESDD